jgi:hypothetical protein
LQPLDRSFAIRFLCSIAAAGNSYNPALINSPRKALEHTPLLHIGKTPALRRVKQQRHSSIDFIDILSPRPAASRKLKNKFILANKDLVFNLNHQIIMNQFQMPTMTKSIEMPLVAPV